jgi:hypothetical protein
MVRSSSTPETEIVLELNSDMRTKGLEEKVENFQRKYSRSLHKLWLLFSHNVRGRGEQESNDSNGNRQYGISNTKEQ